MHQPALPTPPPLPGQNITTPALRSPPPILIPLSLLFIISGLIRIFDIDRALTRLAYDGNGGWPWNNSKPVVLLYQYGAWPLIAIVGLALALCVASVRHKRISPNCPMALFIVIAIALGPGLLVNGFKEYYSRPRPREVIEFGGTHEFSPVFASPVGNRGRSFPSSHAGAGFFWVVFTVFYWERNRRVALAFALVALLHGGSMGVGRMLQGGHWFSDIIWAVGIDYLAAWALYRVLRLRPKDSGVVLQGTETAAG